MVWPLRTEEISQILKMANEKRIPVTPWGAGTSLEGNPIPVEGGIVLDLQQMNHVLELRTEDLQVRVEAGVIYKELNQYLSRFGLFFPPDPGAAATVGGMVGNNASGVRTVKYGATKDYVLEHGDRLAFWRSHPGWNECDQEFIRLRSLPSLCWIRRDTGYRHRGHPSPDRSPGRVHGCRGAIRS